MKKEIDYRFWHDLKYKLDSSSKENIYFKERQVWFLSCGLNIGCEEDGKNKDFSRPVLILKKFNKDMFWGIPLSSKIKFGRYYFVFKFSDERNSCVLLSQLRLFDKKRFIRKVGTMRKMEFLKLRKKLRNLI